ncbi:hypothetical protein C1646_731503 [Rhizophagus diaphanus]|nr:hypothetical protein C1646_731503 [Rhizophagus diaphanus] [Rhizophagus sp. MUCL 43196]
MMVKEVVVIGMNLVDMVVDIGMIGQSIHLLIFLLVEVEGEEEEDYFLCSILIIMGLMVVVVIVAENIALDLELFYLHLT